MNYKISFTERAILAKAILSRQPKPTLELIRKQVETLKKHSQRDKKKNPE